MRLLRTVFIWGVVACLLAVLSSPVRVVADCSDVTDCQAQIDDLTKKIADTRAQSQTLSSAITYLNLKQTLTQRQIDATQFQIQLLQRDIDSLGGKITQLEGSLNSLTASLLKNVETSYEHQNVSDLDVLLSSQNFSQVISTYRYLMVAQKYRQDLLLQTTKTKVEYDLEKSTKEKKQQQIQSLKATYIKQQADLVEQQKAKQLLLTQTKNSEANYQKLLSQAVAELNSFKGFSQSMGGGLVPPQNSPDGWYFSQRDQRWGNMTISSSRDTIMEVGCLISSVAMVEKKYGADVTPASIAANSSYFFSTTAYMLMPWPTPGGFHYLRSGYNQERVDSNLSDGRPVIVHLRVNSRDGHFVVLNSASSGASPIHYPWQGYDKKFKDFYSTGQITDASYLMKN